LRNTREENSRRPAHQQLVDILVWVEDVVGDDCNLALRRREQ
jgi:hypothetical protein